MPEKARRVAEDLGTERLSDAFVLSKRIRCDW
jgi:hypothetical protein